MLTLVISLSAFSVHTPHVLFVTEELLKALWNANKHCESIVKARLSTSWIIHRKIKKSEIWLQVMWISNQVCWIMFIYHRFTEPLSCIWVLFFSFSLQGEIHLKRKVKFLLLQGAATYWVLQWNHNCWQYCEESLPMHYFPSIKMCYKLKHLRKMGVLCRYNKFSRKILTPPWNFPEHCCSNCCIQWWHRTVSGGQKFMVLCSLSEELHSFSQDLQGWFFFLPWWVWSGGTDMLLASCELL